MTRAQRRQAGKHKDVLYDHLAWMYAFLGKTPQPSDSEVIKVFSEKKRSWYDYCIKHNLNDEVKHLFANEIATTCQKRKKLSEEA